MTMTLELDLQHEMVTHLDIGSFTQVISGTLVKDTVEKMRYENHNCAIISKSGKPVGIFTDRDLLLRVVDNPETWNVPIDEIMTTAPITVNVTDPAYQAMEVMDKKHIRNVPVLDGKGHVAGNLTHYAIIKFLADRFPSAVYNLPPDSDRVTKHRDGA
jgi:signal-transduction protein with cAMP-binding, CBS, and nucleotidyltransferase domain